MSKYIYHYTDIETLALILKNKTVRFNRLDRVDDISESSFEKVALQKFLFVSCWTTDEKESLPQWNMYTRDMAGVRIKMAKEPFHEYVIEFKNHLRFLGPKMTNSPLPLERLATEDYFVMSNFSDKANFGRSVNYTDNFAELKNEKIEISQPNEPFFLQIGNIAGTASLKSTDWKFQKEFRFILLILPLLSRSFRNWQDRFHSSIRFYFQNGESPTFDHFDVELRDDVIDNIEVTTGPLCSHGEKIIVKSLMEKFTQSGTMNSSSLEGTIRSRK
jgi:hypothetical protein